MTTAYEDVTRELIGSGGESVLLKWLPGGRRRGREFVAGSLKGEPGESLSVNLETGAWADFATDEKGRDLVSLYAKINGISNARALAILGGTRHGEFRFRAGSLDPSRIWRYYDSAGAEVLVVTRYDQPDGKTFRQWVPAANGSYEARGLAENRPLYRLREIMSAPSLPVMIVEGEKAADAALALTEGKYAVTCWPGGASAWRKADFSPLAGRRVALWPDADDPGRAAMVNVKDKLVAMGCQVSLLRVDGHTGWDAADALEENWNYDKLVTWARGIVERYDPQAPAVPVVEKHISIEVVDESVDEFPVIPMSHSDLWTACGIRFSQRGVPITNIDSFWKLLKGLPDVGSRYRYDLFARRITIDGRPLIDEDVIGLTRFFQGKCGMSSASNNNVLLALQEWSRRNSYNEPLDWLASIKWDGTERLAKLMPLVFGASDNEYTRFVGTSMLVTAVARVMNPGCQVDTMVILEGGQGAFKSSALQILGGKWHIESHDEIGSKDFLCALAGSIIVEIAELESFSKADASRIKRVITARVDRIRKPYGRIHEDHKRSCILVGTTNEKHYLRDSTGARRFLPVACGTIDRDTLREHRDQLWAEAVHLYKAEWAWWDCPGAKVEQEQRRRRDPLEDIIRASLKLRTDASIGEIMVDILRIEPGNITQAKTAQVVAAMQSIGWEARYTMDNGKLEERWVPGGQKNLD